MVWSCVVNLVFLFGLLQGFAVAIWLLLQQIGCWMICYLCLGLLVGAGVVCWFGLFVCGCLGFMR